MKARIRSLSIILMLCLILGCLAACVKAPQDPADSSTVTDGESHTGEPSREFVDYVSQLKLDMSNGTAKQEVTVKTFVDGDTTHFNVPSSVAENGVLKARYIAINTPESTGKIEEYGKAASRFTKEKLSGAKSIIVESDTASWNLDSTGGRYLVWVWYKPSDSEDYRNLNLEILQNGLALASSTANNRYGEICMNALNQAKTLKYKLYSGEKDPDFPYGAAQELTLKELRCNVEKYSGAKVAFEGVITMNYNNGVYIEDYDAESNMYYGIYVYYGFGLSGDGLEILNVGNRSRIVGTVQYYEAGGTYQVSGLEYSKMRPNNPDNIKKISDGHSAAYTLTSAETLNSKVKLELTEGEEKEYDYASLVMNTTVSMQGLTVKSVYMTENEDSSSYGALTLTCEVNGEKVTVRTVPMYDENKNLIGADYYKGKVIDVKGVVDFFSGSYQIKVLSKDHITVK